MPHRSCFLLAFAETPCDGGWQRAHLIKRQTIRREIKTASRSHRALCEDPRAWVWACVHHHGQLDHSRKLRIPRHRLPPAVEDFARQYGLEWFLCREYGCDPSTCRH